MDLDVYGFPREARIRRWAMPKGPRGEKRPADVIGNAVKVMRVATGKDTEELAPEVRSAAAELGRRGGEARAHKLSKPKRRQIAKLAARARWTKQK
jgi:hypothetical protein